MEFYNHRYPVAKKNHICELCKDSIVSGCKYSYESGMYEGRFFVRKLCLSCSNILDDFLKEIEDEDEEFSWDWIVDWLIDRYCYSCDSKIGCSLSVVDWLIDRYCYSCDSKIGCSLSVVTCNKVKKDYGNITKV